MSSWEARAVTGAQPAVRRRTPPPSSTANRRSTPANSENGPLCSTSATLTRTAQRRGSGQASSVRVHPPPLAQRSGATCVGCTILTSRPRSSAAGRAGLPACSSSHRGGRSADLTATDKRRVFSEDAAALASGTRMTSRSTLHFDRALLPGGWASDVRVTVADGRIGAIEAGAPVDAAGERHAPACRASATATATPSSGRWPASPSGRMRPPPRSGPGATRCTAFSIAWPRRARGDRRASLPRDARGRVHARGRVPLPAPRSAGPRVRGHRARWRLASAAAAADTGIALTLLPVFYAHAGFGGAPPTAAQRRFTCSLDQFRRLLVSCERATATLPDARARRRAAQPARGRGDGAARARAAAGRAAASSAHRRAGQEVADCIARSGQSPVQWLLDRSRSIRAGPLIHATHVMPEELAAIARSRAVVDLCPITEANLGDGVFPAGAYLAADGAFCIGTDSNVTIDAAAELRLLEYGQRLTSRARNVLAAPGGASTGRVLFERARAGGAQSLGEKTAGLVAGAPADIVSLDTTLGALRREPGRTSGSITGSSRLAGRWSTACGARDGSSCERRAPRPRRADRAALSRGARAAGVAAPPGERLCADHPFGA